MTKYCSLELVRVHGEMKFTQINHEIVPFATITLVWFGLHLNMDNRFFFATFTMAKYDKDVGSKVQTNQPNVDNESVLSPHHECFVVMWDLWSCDIKPFILPLEQSLFWYGQVNQHILLPVTAMSLFLLLQYDCMWVFILFFWANPFPQSAQKYSGGLCIFSCRLMSLGVLKHFPQTEQEYGVKSECTIFLWRFLSPGRLKHLSHTSHM